MFFCAKPTGPRLDFCTAGHCSLSFKRGPSQRWQSLLRNFSANGWSPQIAQPGFALTGGLALALLFGKSMVGPLFAQTAWTNVTFVGSEVRDPGRNLARAMLFGCGIVVILYLLANLAYIAVLPFS